MKRTSYLVTLITFLAMSSPSTVLAMKVFYAAESNDPFITHVDPNTADEGAAGFVFVDPFNSQGLTALAAHPQTGELFAVLDTEEAFHRLVKYNPRTFETTDIGNIGELITGLAFAESGAPTAFGSAATVTLYGVTSDDVSGTTDTIFTIDTGTALPTFFMNLPAPDGFGDTIAFNPDDGKLYHWTGSNTVAFNAIDLSTKTSVSVPLSGNRPLGVGIRAFTYDSDQQLFIAYRSNDLATTMEFATITPGGFQTFVSGAAFEEAGLAFYDGDLLGPVPDPSSGRYMYGVDVPGPYISQIDPATGNDIATQAITVPGAVITGSNGLAVHPISGEMYAVVRFASGGTRRLVTLDPVTGAATLIGNTGERLAALAFDSAGTLYALSGSGGVTPSTLYTVNTSTAALTFFQDLSSIYSGESMAYNPNDGQMYHTAGWDTFPLLFEKIDLGTGVRTNIPYSGDFAVPSEIIGFVYDSSQCLFLGNKWTATDTTYFSLTSTGVVTNIQATPTPKRGFAFSVPTPPPFTSVAGLSDINGNGFSDIAVIVQAASSHVHIRDGDTGELLSDINFGDDTISAMAVIDDISNPPNGMPEVALLSTLANNNVRVQAKDSDTGALVNSIGYGAGYSAVGMAVLPDTDSNGAPEFAVLGADVAGSIRVQARDSVSDVATSTTFYGDKGPPLDVLVLPDMSANGEPEVLMNGEVTASGQTRTQMRDSDTKALIRNFFFGTAYKSLELSVIEDLTGDGIADLAQLGRRGDNCSTRVQVKRSDTGATISNAFTGSTDEPISVVGIGDANADTVPDVALLVKRPNGTARVFVRDGATGDPIRNIFAGQVSNPVAMALIDDLDASGDPELLILGDDGAGTKRVQVKDSISGDTINVIDFPVL